MYAATTNTKQKPVTKQKPYKIFVDHILIYEGLQLNTGSII